MSKRELAIVFDDYSVQFLEAKIKGTRIRKVYNTYLKENIDLFKEGTFDLEAWEEILAEIKSQRLFKARNVHIILPTSIVMLREKDFPEFPKEHLKAIVTSEIINTSLFPFADPIFDLVRVGHEEIEESADGEKQYKYVIVAAPGIIINLIVQSLMKERLRIRSVDIAASAIWNYFEVFSEPNEHEVRILAQVTRKGFDIHIYDRDILFFTRHAPFNTGKLIDSDGSLDEGALAEAFAGEVDRAKGYFNFTLNKRDREISWLGLISNIEITDRFSAQVKESLDMELSFLNRTVRSLPRSIRRCYGYELALGALLRGVEK